MSRNETPKTATILLILARVRPRTREKQNERHEHRAQRRATHPHTAATGGPLMGGWRRCAMD